MNFHVCTSQHHTLLDQRPSLPLTGLGLAPGPFAALGKSSGFLHHTRPQQVLEPWVLAGLGTSCLTLPLGSLAVIKAGLHTTAGQGQRLAGEKEGILRGKSFSLPSREGQELLLTMQVPIPPPFHIPSLHFPTLPSPSSWKFPTSVGPSILPVHCFPFLCSHLQFLNPLCSCSFPPD